MPAQRDWDVLKPYIMLIVAVMSGFLGGSFLLDALLPAGIRRAALLTLPTATGDPLTDYALTVYQALVLGAGVTVGGRMTRRRAAR